MLALLISPTSAKSLIFLNHIMYSRNSVCTSLVLTLLPDNNFIYVEEGYLERRSGVDDSIIFGLFMDDITEVG